MAGQAHAKIRNFSKIAYPARSLSMDVEHINAIGNTLSDLTRRTLDLRGFL